MRWPRVLAALLSLAWLSVAIVPWVAAGGARPALWVSVVAVLVAGLCLFAAVRPANAGDEHGGAALTGLVALLATIPLLPFATLAPSSHLTPPGSDTPEGAYAVVFAGLLSAAFAGWSAGSSRRALTIAAGVGALGVLAAAVALAGSPIEDRPPAGCLVPRPAEAGDLRLSARAMVDGRPLDSLVVEGERAAGFDRQLLEVLSGLPLAATENLGLGPQAATRHCRLAIDGDIALRAMPPLSELIDAAPAEVGVGAGPLSIWRGELDWWIAANGRLAGARVLIGGHPADAWGIGGLRGRLVGELSVGASGVPATREEALP